MEGGGGKHLQKTNTKKTSRGEKKNPQGPTKHIKKQNAQNIKKGEGKGGGGGEPLPT